MAFFRKFFYRKPPDGLLEISERVFVFDCCFMTDILEDEEYKVYLGSIVGQLRECFPEALFMVFNFREGEYQSQISQVLSEFDMTVLDYPRHYEGCPLLSMETVHHFLRSSENWLCLGHQNVLLMHCERGGWPVLAFMLAALLIYRKQFTGEQKTLDMIYKQAPCELLRLMSPLNPLPSQLRYLQYVSRRNVGSEWPPLDRALTLDCVILRIIPNLDGEGGCRPIFRIYGQDPLMVADRTPKLLFSTPKRSKVVRHYKQADCELVKIDIYCHIQGDVVLECISLDNDQEREEMMFRVMFNTAFIRANILMLNRDEIDIFWNSKDRFPKDFRAEILFSEMDGATSLVSIDLPGIEEKDALHIEAFAKVQEIFSIVDWLDPNSDIAGNMLQHLKPSNIVEKKLETGSPQNAEKCSIVLESALEKDKEQLKLKPSDSIGVPASIQGKPFLPSVKTHLRVNSFKKNETQELQGTVQQSAQSKIISPRLPQTSLAASQVSPISRYHSAPSSVGISALLHDHDRYIQEITQQVKKSLPAAPISPSVTNILKPPPPSHVSNPLPPPPPLPFQPPSAQASLVPPKIIQNTPMIPSPPLPTLNATQPFPSQSPGTTSPSIDHSLTDSFTTLPSTSEVAANAMKNLHSNPPSPPPPPSFEVTSPSSMAMHSFTTSPCPPPPPPLPPPTSFPRTSQSFVVNKSLLTPPPPPPPPSFSRTSSTSSPVKNTFSAPPPSSQPPSLSGISPASSVKNSLSSPPSPPSPQQFSVTSLPSSFENSFSNTVHPPLPPSFSGASLPSIVNNLFSTPLPSPPPMVAFSTASSFCCPLATESSKITSGLPPPPPPDLHSTGSISTPLAPPPPASSFTLKDSLTHNSATVPPVPPPPAPIAKGLSLSKASDASPLSNSGVNNGNIPSGAPLSAKLRGLARAIPRFQSQPRKNNLKPYHWLKLTRAMQGSLWAEAQKSDEALKTPEFDMSELEALFSAAAPNSDYVGKSGKSNRRYGPKSERVQLIELRRANNCEIMLTKVKIPLPYLMNSVLALDDSALDIDQIDNLIKFCPTKEEIEILKNYTGDKRNLGKCEQWKKIFVSADGHVIVGFRRIDYLYRMEVAELPFMFFLELMKVPRVESKLRVFSFKLQFQTQVSDLGNSLNIINSASEEVRNSVKLKRIMQTILSLGNALNHGTARGSAVGFRLDSLLKLTDTRARNNKMTLMHYLCKVLAEKLPELLDFPKDLVSLEASTKIQLKFLAEEMQAISKGLEKVVQELTNSENQGEVLQNFCKLLKEFVSYAEGEVRSLASLYSSVGRNADALAQYFGEDPARCPFEQVVSTLLNFVRMFVRAHEENCKQLEYERKKAEKEAKNEKLKAEKKQSEHLVQNPLKRSTIK